MKLYAARQLSGCAYLITSAMRCEEHNKASKGSPNSSHLEGWAIDIHTNNSVVRWRVLYGVVMAGFRRVGMANTFIHVDNDPAKPEGVVWLYQ